MIPYGRQIISEADIKAVVDVLRSDFLTQGPCIPRFEEAISSHVGVDYAVAVSNATAALHIACLALDVGPGDRVWTSPNTFVASANCARYCGATVDFVDIDPRTFNLCPARLEDKLHKAKQSGSLPKVVIPVHFAGLPCDMKAIRALSQKYGFAVIEDASHAIGATYNDQHIGSCEFSDVTIFSFHPVKIITTGEGGMATTKSKSLAKRMQLLRSHGITRTQEDFFSTENAPWYYEQQTLGFNYRITDIQAALGISQLERLNHWIDQRHHIANHYDEAFAKLPLTLPIQRTSEMRSALHLYVVQLDSSKTRITRKDAFNALRSTGIGVNVHYIPVYRQPDFSKFGFKLDEFPNCEEYYEHCISLPMHAGLSSEDLQTVITSVNNLFA